MDRKEFVKSFNIENSHELSALFEKVELAKECEMMMYSDKFYSPEVWMKLEKLSKKLGIEVISQGGFEGSERRVIGVNAVDGQIYEDFPITYLRITNLSKFKDLEHKHFLGTIISLGIKREKISDLIVEDRSCYFGIMTELYPFLKENLETINRLPIEIEKITKEELPEYKFTKEVILVPSYRLDSIVSKLFNKSRNEVVEKIKQKEIRVNYQVTTKKDMGIKEGDILSIKRLGKFIIGKEIGISKKEKIRVEIKKYN